MTLLLHTLPEFRKKRILFVTHAGCDVDAIGAAAALYFSLKNHNSAKIIVPEHISQPAMRFARKAGIPYSLSSARKLPRADCLFLIDFNSQALAGKLGPAIRASKARKYLIDHHTPGRESLAKRKNSLVNKNAVASCELAFDLLKRSRLPITDKIATCIAAGLITDSAFFLTANSKTFSIMAETMNRSGRTFSGLTSLFAVERKFDEKIAMLKAAKRTRIFRLGNYIVAAADIGAFEANAASTLVKIGADIAFAGNADRGRIRISGRANQRAVRRQGFDLAQHVFQKMPHFFPGKGGGHAGAAAFSGKGNSTSQALQRCVSLTAKYFRGRKPGIQLKEYT